MKYITDRLKEAGTYRVIAGFVAGVLGPVFTDGQIELAFQIGSGAVLLWESLKPSASSVK